ncbi:unnamed protein product [Camellia sinensis]
MKKTNNPFPFLSTFLIILSTFTTTPNPILLVTAQNSTSPNNPAVLDTQNHTLQTGQYYYILPATTITTGGGGLKLASTGHNATTACPLAVVQDQNELNKGLPLTFSPVNLTNGVVRVSTDLNIKFTSRAETVCDGESSVWRLDESIGGERFVMSGGVEGNPGRETLSNWFEIEKFDDDYKLVFCPTVCNICKVACGDIGVYVDENGTRRLAVSEVPLKVMFLKV